MSFIQDSVSQVSMVGHTHCVAMPPQLIVPERHWKEGRKEILLMRATTKVDWHVNVWSE